MDTTKPLVQNLSGAQVQGEALVAFIRSLIVQANEEAPVNPTVGTVDEAQAEVLANIELALRHVEDATNRLSLAGVAWGPLPSQGDTGAGLDAASA